LTSQAYPVQRTLSGYATLLSAGGSLAPVSTEPASVQAADLHGNRLVLRPLRRLFSGRPIFVGDFGQRGTRAEADAFIPQVTALGDSLVAVSGNHDSRSFMRRLARAGVTVLTDRGRLRPGGGTDGKPVRRIAGLRIAGWPDPLEWRGRDPGDPRRVFSFAERPDGEREYARAVRRLVRWFEGLRPRPDVVLVHPNGLAQRLARQVSETQPGRELLVLTGHDHRQHIDRYGDVLVVDAGTVGAGGVFGVATESVGLAQLHIPGGRVLPRAVDLIRVEPVSGAASAERVVVSSPRACEREFAATAADPPTCARPRARRARGSPARSWRSRQPSRAAS
jgi:predicted phosphodiesterase